jgi:hypothetical protein
MLVAFLAPFAFPWAFLVKSKSKFQMLPRCLLLNLSAFTAFLSSIFLILGAIGMKEGYSPYITETHIPRIFYAILYLVPTESYLYNIQFFTIPFIFTLMFSISIIFRKDADSQKIKSAALIVGLWISSLMLIGILAFQSPFIKYYCSTDLFLGIAILINGIACFIFPAILIIAYTSKNSSNNKKYNFLYFFLSVLASLSILAAGLFSKNRIGLMQDFMQGEPVPTLFKFIQHLTSNLSTIIELSMSAGFITFIVGYALARRNQNTASWKHVLYITFVLSIISFFNLSTSGYCARGYNICFCCMCGICQGIRVIPYHEQTFSPLILTILSTMILSLFIISIVKVKPTMRTVLYWVSGISLFVMLTIVFIHNINQKIYLKKYAVINKQGNVILSTGSSRYFEYGNKNYTIVYKFNPFLFIYELKITSLAKNKIKTLKIGFSDTFDLENKFLIETKNYNRVFYDFQGNFLFQTSYNPQYFSEGLAVISNPKGKYGFIDKKGSLIIPCKYFDARSFSEGLAAVRESNKTESFPSGVISAENWSFINLKGKVQFSIKCTEIKSFKNGMAAVNINNKWGYIDRAGKLVIKPLYKNADNFSENLAWVSLKNDRYGFINKHGEWIIPAHYSSEKRAAFSEGLAAMKDDKKEKWGYIDKTGKFVLPPIYERACDFKFGYANVELSKELRPFSKEIFKPVAPDVKIYWH